MKFRFDLNITTVEPWITTSNDLSSANGHLRQNGWLSHLPNLVVMLRANPQHSPGLPTENTDTFLFSPAILWKVKAPHKPQAAKWGVYHETLKCITSFWRAGNKTIPSSFIYSYTIKAKSFVQITELGSDWTNWISIAQVGFWTVLYDIQKTEDFLYKWKCACVEGQQMIWLLPRK